MSPLHSSSRVVRIARPIGVCVVLTVLRNPFDGTTLKCERAENGQRILEGLRHRQAPMRKKPVKPKRDAERGYDVKSDSDRHTGPREEDRQKNPERDGMDYKQHNSNWDVARAFGTR